MNNTNSHEQKVVLETGKSHHRKATGSAILTHGVKKFALPHHSNLHQSRISRGYPIAMMIANTAQNQMRTRRSYFHQAVATGCS
jgi:hypothetical protein